MKKSLTLFISLLALGPVFLLSKSKLPDSWVKWLDEVDLIMTRAERSVFESLKTEENMERFQQLFWRARDPKPETPQNEFMIEYYQRRRYAENRLEGAKSDRGRVYILLGEPSERTDFSGSEDLVDCELWFYRNEGKTELPPYVELIFYRPRNLGEYRLFYPGLQTALDLISPGTSAEISSREQAYDQVKADSAELAEASLSVIPGEGDRSFGQTLSSSNTVLARIFSLPEREFEQSYIRNFNVPTGLVSSTTSFKEIDAEGRIEISENSGLRFLNYALMPKALHTVKTPGDSYSARINIHLRIEDLKGKTIYQKERNLELKLDEGEKNAMDSKRAVFEDITPIIDGDFIILVALFNKTTDEFCVYKEKLSLGPETIPLAVGFKAEENLTGKFQPFGMGRYEVYGDPRLVFNKADSIEGVVVTQEKPLIRLTDAENPGESMDVLDIAQKGNAFVFKQPLNRVRSRSYYLVITVKNREVYRKIVSVLPFLARKPIAYRWPEPASSGANHLFIIGQEYLSKGDPGKAVECFQKIPAALWDSKKLAVFAQAYYEEANYERAVEILEKSGGEKDYSVLFLLGNSYIELRRFRQAADVFEKLRAYGENSKIDRTLGAIYYSLGDRAKAKFYMDRGQELEGKQKKR